MENQYYTEKLAGYSLSIGSEEYELRVNRTGNTQCLHRSALVRQIQQEDPLMILKASSLIGDPKASSRYRYLLQAYTFSLRVPRSTAKIIWDRWTRTDPGIPETYRATIPHQVEQSLIDRVVTEAIKSQRRISEES